VVKEQGERPSVVDPARRRNILAERLENLRLLNSPKIQYQKALYLQKLEAEPDAILCRIKYHMSWSVTERKSVFADVPKHFKVIADSLFRAQAPSVFDSHLLWLAPDHLHVYCESDGTASPEAIVVHLKRISAQAFMTERAAPLPHCINPPDLWDESYFIESLGL
jgi:REP element-mobilizing transposase RayT